MCNVDYDGGKWYDQIYENSVATAKECPNCEGSGKELEVYSCCGDVIESEDCDICPTCGEHCGFEHEVCDECNGEGVI